MANSIINLVVYTGGACGDLITSMIDSTDVEIKNNRVALPAHRQRLKKPHEFIGDQEKDHYIEEMSKIYDSIPSHDFRYHRDRQHDFILINVDDDHVAIWAARRFQDLHRPHVWQEMVRSCGAKDAADYAQIMMDFSSMARSTARHVIQLSRILGGHAANDLEQILDRDLDPISRDFYQQWLAVQ